MEAAMQKCYVAGFALASFVLVLANGVNVKAEAQTEKSPYPAMAPLEQYLIANKDAEIALARSAAPASIADKADIMVLGRDGYTTAVKGSNGFVCIVERSWASPSDQPGFW